MLNAGKLDFQKSKELDGSCQDEHKIILVRFVKVLASCYNSVRVRDDLCQESSSLPLFQQLLGQFELHVLVAGEVFQLDASALIQPVQLRIFHG